MTHQYRVLLLLLLLLCSCQASPAAQPGNVCKVEIRPSQPHQYVDRDSLAAFSSKTPILVCPFSRSDTVVLYKKDCGGASLGGRFRILATTYDDRRANREFEQCSPARSIVGNLKEKAGDSFDTIILSYTDEPYSLTNIGTKIHVLDSRLRVWMMSTGEPISYYNSAGNIICLRIERERESALKSEISREGAEKDLLLNSYSEDCPTVARAKYSLVFSSPAPEHDPSDLHPSAASREARQVR